MRALLLLALVGCGDDTSPPGDAGGTRDGGPRRDAAEVGDTGMSGDDAGTDAGPPPCVPVSDRVVSDAPGAAGRPSIAWSGDGYAIAFGDDRGGTSQIFVTLLDAAGDKVGTDHGVTSGARAAGLPDIAFDGTNYGIGYVTEMPMPAQVHFVRVAPDGTVVGSVLDVGQGGGISSIVWNGTEYGLAHHSARDMAASTDVYFARISSAGALIGAETRVTDTVAPEFIPALAWNGTDYGIAYHRGGGSSATEAGLYLARVDASGMEIGTEARVPNTMMGGAVRLAASPTGYAFTWGTGDMAGMNAGRLARLDASGAPTGAADTELPRPPSDVAFAAGRYAAAWSMSGAVMGGEVVVATYPEADGVPSAPFMITTGGVAAVNAIALAWNGSGWAVAWADSRAMPAEIHFAVVCL